MKLPILILLFLSLHVALFASFEKGFEAYHAKDYSQAIALWSDACEAKDSASCMLLAFMHDNGKGVKEDKKKAKLYYQKACTLHDSVGCDFFQKLQSMGY